MESYKLQISEWSTTTSSIRSSSISREGGRTPVYVDGFIEELSTSASLEGGTYAKDFRTEKSTPRFSQPDNEADFPADWIQYITDHAWVFNDIKSFAAFVGTAWGLYEKFKPKGSAVKDATMTVFVGGKPISIKKGEDIEEIARRARADDTR